MHTSPNLENPEHFTKILQNTTEILIDSDISFSLGRTYNVYLKAINNAGLSTLFVSNGVVVDRTPPSTGRVSAAFSLPENYDGNPNIADDASFQVRWAGFIDKESGIQSYKWAIGVDREKTRKMADDLFINIQSSVSTNGYVIKNQTIRTSTVYYVCIRIANGAGLSTTNCSRGVRVELGRLTPGAVFDGPFKHDIDFQLDDKALWVDWTGFKDPVYGLKKYSWCYGLVSSLDNDTFSCSSALFDVDPPLKNSAHKFHNVSLLHGKRYNAKVEVINQREEMVSAISDGVAVDRTAPNAGKVEFGGSQSSPTVYLTGISAPIVSWSMYESESTLQEFQLGIGRFPHCDDLLSYINLDGSTSSFNLEQTSTLVTALIFTSAFLE